MATRTPKAAAAAPAPAGLPDELAPFVVECPTVKIGGWTYPAGPGLDITKPEVQAAAYALLSGGLTAPAAMMGGQGAPVGDDRDARVSGGAAADAYDGRWFHTCPDVLKAAEAHRKAGDLPTWRKGRKPAAPAVEVEAEVEAPAA